MNMTLSEALQSEKLVILDFFSPSCAPCRRLSPILDELGTNLKSVIDVVKINVFDDLGRMEAVNLNIEALPTIVFFKNGQEVKRLVGLQTKEQLGRIINECS